MHTTHEAFAVKRSGKGEDRRGFLKWAGAAALSLAFAGAVIGGLAVALIFDAIGTNLAALAIPWAISFTVFHLVCVLGTPRHPRPI
jgi:hypothetical protein